MTECIFEVECFEQLNAVTDMVDSMDDDGNPFFKAMIKEQIALVCAQYDNGCSATFDLVASCALSECTQSSCLSPECDQQFEDCYNSPDCVDAFMYAMSLLNDDDMMTTTTTAPPFRRRMYDNSYEPYGGYNDGSESDDNRDDRDEGPGPMLMANLMYYTYKQNCGGEEQPACNDQLFAVLNCAMNAEACKDYGQKSGDCMSGVCYSSLTMCIQDDMCADEFFELMDYFDRCDDAGETTTDCYETENGDWMCEEHPILSPDEEAACLAFRAENGYDDDVQYFQYMCWREGGCSPMFKDLFLCISDCEGSHDDGNGDGNDGDDCMDMCNQQIFVCMFDQQCYHAATALFMLLDGEDDPVGHWVEQQSMAGQLNDASWEQFVNENVCSMEGVVCTMSFYDVIGCMWDHCLLPHIPCWINGCFADFVNCFEDCQCTGEQCGGCQIDGCRAFSDHPEGCGMQCDSLFDDGMMTTTTAAPKNRRRMMMQTSEDPMPYSTEVANNDGGMFPDLHLPEMINEETMMQWRDEAIQRGCNGDVTMCTPLFGQVIECFYNACLYPPDQPTDGDADSDSDGIADGGDSDGMAADGTTEDPDIGDHDVDGTTMLTTFMAMLCSLLFAVAFV
jgi:hypothetical protein